MSLSVRQRFVKRALVGSCYLLLFALGYLIVLYAQDYLALQDSLTIRLRRYAAVGVVLGAISCAFVMAALVALYKTQ